MTHPIDVQEALQAAGAVLLDGHFIYKGGKHGSGYINLDPLLTDADLMTRICGRLVAPFLSQVETVAAPAVGGVVLSVLSAVAASQTGRRVRAVWADKTKDNFSFDRAGFAEHLKNKKVLVVEDLLTTGDSVRKVCREAERHGAHLVGVSAICNRGGVTAKNLGVPRLESLIKTEFEAVEPSACPLCRIGRPVIEDIGHGRSFRQQHPDYPGGYARLLRSDLR